MSEQTSETQCDKKSINKDAISVFKYEVAEVGIYHYKNIEATAINILGEIKK